MQPTTYPATQFKCENCGWKIIRPEYTHGDCLTPDDLRWRKGVEICPQCASNRISSSDASGLQNSLSIKAFGKWLLQMISNKPSKFDI